MFGSLILLLLHKEYDEMMTEGLPPKETTRFAVEHSDELLTLEPPKQTIRTDRIERLEIDARLNTRGGLTVTEKLIVPPHLNVLPAEGGFTQVLQTSTQKLNLPESLVAPKISARNPQLLGAYSVEILDDFSNGLYNFVYWFYVALASSFAIVIAVVLPVGLWKDRNRTMEVREAWRVQYEKDYPPGK